MEDYFQGQLLVRHLPEDSLTGGQLSKTFARDNCPRDIWRTDICHWLFARWSSERKTFAKEAIDKRRILGAIVSEKFAKTTFTRRQGQLSNVNLPEKQLLEGRLTEGQLPWRRLPE